MCFILCVNQLKDVCTVSKSLMSSLNHKCCEWKPDSFSCSDDASVAQLDDISARKRGAWGEDGQSDSNRQPACFSNQDYSNIKREMEIKREGHKLKET